LIGLRHSAALPKRIDVLRPLCGCMPRENSIDRYHAAMATPEASGKIVVARACIVSSRGSRSGFCTGLESAKTVSGFYLSPAAGHGIAIFRRRDTFMHCLKRRGGS
jgi:hypothetical protein